MKRLGALVPLTATGAWSQCVMCFRTAAAQQAERARVLNLGILILLVPPVMILAGFVLLLYFRRKSYATPDSELVEAPASLATPGRRATRLFPGVAALRR